MNGGDRVTIKPTREQAVELFRVVGTYPDLFLAEMQLPLRVVLDGAAKTGGGSVPGCSCSGGEAQ